MTRHKSGTPNGHVSKSKFKCDGSFFSGCKQFSDFGNKTYCLNEQCFWRIPLQFVTIVICTLICSLKTESNGIDAVGARVLVQLNATST